MCRLNTFAKSTVAHSFLCPIETVVIARCLLEVIEEHCFKFSLAMVVGLVRLQNLVEPFVQERPEVMEWAIIPHIQLCGSSNGDSV